MHQFTLKQWLVWMTLVTVGFGLLVGAFLPLGNPAAVHEEPRTLELVARVGAFLMGSALLAGAFMKMLPEAVLQSLFTVLMTAFIGIWFNEQITFLLNLFFKNFLMCFFSALGAVVVFQFFKRLRRKSPPDAE